ncbi:MULTISPECIES: hypothetical protein [Olivibacter]|uniref:Right handed beta helix domain-containing protein n=1 Tax=Olivibacter jilunii TaxID=985016 RepID=A0ABW6AZ39_9SPHI
MANQFLVKKTMADMRNLSANEIADLQTNVFDGVLLMGYYTLGDTPGPIVYHLSSTAKVDDGGSVIQVANIKLEHLFASAIDVRYFGLRSGQPHINDPETVNNIFINNAGKEIVFDYDTDFTMSMGTYWDNGTITIPSNTKVTINGIVRHSESRNANASIFLIREVQNVVIEGSGVVIGYKHKRPPIGIANAYYKSYYKNRPYSIGEYLDFNSFGFIVTQAGIGTAIPTPTTETEIGTIFKVGGDQGLQLQLIEKGLGEWGYGIYLFAAKNVVIKGITLRECWGDGSAMGGPDTNVSVLKPCENIKFIDCVFNDNRRQGCSVVTANDVFFDNCQFINTYGTLPMAGVDLEPNMINSDGSLKVGYVRNIRFRGCKFNGNYQGLLCYNPFSDMPDRLTYVNVEDCVLEGNMSFNLVCNKSGVIKLARASIKTTVEGGFGGEISVATEDFEMENSEIIFDSDSPNTNVAIINLRNLFTDKSLAKRFIIKASDISTKQLAKAFLTYQDNFPNIQLEINNTNIDVKLAGLINTGGNCTDLGSFKMQNCNVASGSGYVSNKNTTNGQEFTVSRSSFKVSSNAASASEPFFISGGLIRFFNIEYNTFENLEIEQREFQILRINNAGTGFRSIVAKNTFIGFHRTNSELIQSLGGTTSTPTHLIEDNIFISCEVPYLFSTNRTRHCFLSIVNNKNNVGTAEGILRIDGGTGTPIGGWRVYFNLNSCVSLGNFYDPSRFDDAYTFCHNNVLNYIFRPKNQLTYDQSMAVPNSTLANATELNSAILLVNDLKAKLNAKLDADRDSDQQAS